MGILDIVVPCSDAGHDVVEDIGKNCCAGVSLLDLDTGRIRGRDAFEQRVWNGIGEDEQEEGNRGQTPAVGPDIVSF